MGLGPWAMGLTGLGLGWAWCSWTWAVGWAGLSVLEPIPNTEAGPLSKSGHLSHIFFDGLPQPLGGLSCVWDWPSIWTENVPPPWIAVGETSCLCLRHRVLWHVTWALIFEGKESFYLTKSSSAKKSAKMMDTSHNTKLTEKILQTHCPTPRESRRIFNCFRWVYTLHFTWHRRHQAAGIITIREHWR